MKKDATVVEDESDNHVIHCEFDLSESGLEYRAGDAVGIYPRNFTDEVDWFLDLVGATGTETVRGVSVVGVGFGVDVLQFCLCDELGVCGFVEWNTLFVIYR